jgi:hypothetical protein
MNTGPGRAGSWRVIWLLKLKGQSSYGTFCSKVIEGIEIVPNMDAKKGNEGIKDKNARRCERGMQSTE